MGGFHEECGVFGVYSSRRTHVADTVYYGLYALQHRGQESCGITVNDDGVFASQKGLGLVSEVFTQASLAAFPEGSIAVGHTRYSTTGCSSIKNCQPIEVDHQKGKLAIAHNGNLSNASKLRSDLELSGAIFHSSSDTEIIAYLITKERLRTDCIEDAVSRAVELLEGAFSLAIMSARKLICVRDRHGFRPLCYGVMPDGAYAVASESCALDAVGAKF
ncbi:MAG: class II glutamine amidotransferase, partial [Clostridia bacterium]|nr:class II glutamine amidotransferase [Clostridia bacterium]